MKHAAVLLGGYLPRSLGFSVGWLHDRIKVDAVVMKKGFLKVSSAFCHQSSFHQCTILILSPSPETCRNPDQ